MLYISPKVIFNGQIAEFGPSTLEIKNIYTTGYIQLHSDYEGTLPTQGLSSDKSHTFGALALGIDLFNIFKLPIRLEVEISTRSDNKIKGSSIKYDPTFGTSVTLEARSMSYSIHTSFFNIFLDWHNNTKFTPYIGGGIGLAHKKGRAEIYNDVNFIGYWTGTGYYDGGMGMRVNPEGLGINKFAARSSDLAWHIDIGVSYTITSTFNVDISYRYTDLGKALSIATDPRGFSWRHQGYFTDFPVGNPQYTGSQDLDVDLILEGPKEIKLKPIHQCIFGFRYSFI